MSFLALLLSLSFAFTLELFPQMANLKSFPRQLEGEKLRALLLEDSYPKTRLYLGNVPLTEGLMKKLLDNANLDTVPQQVDVKYGITLRKTDLKLLPTELAVHKGNPEIDYNQYTALDPLTPLAVLHRSKDGRWFYVQGPIMRGWLKAEDVRELGEEEFFRLLDLPFLVVVKPKLKIGGLEYSMSAKIPYLSKEKDRYLVLMPDGSVEWIKGEGFIEGYWQFSEDKAKLLLDSLLGMPYEWGSFYDCSALVRAFFGVFGIELPRNSNQQATVGRGVERTFNSYQELKALLKTFPPYRTVLYMKGHIMIFGGFEGEDPVIYHAVYGIKRDDGKMIYPKAAVKNLLERDGFTNLYKRIVAVRVY
jgi:hypothetical protein